MSPPRPSRAPAVLARLAALAGLALALVGTGGVSADPGAVRELRWPELIPESLAGVPVRPGAVDHDGDVMTQLSPWGDLEMSALLVPEVDGEAVRISGFVVPLNLSADDRVDSFLLVPYFGACVHVPPPPPNQVILVRADPGLDASRIYDAWTVTGTLRVGARSSAMAEAGYTLEATDLRLHGS